MIMASEAELKSLPLFTVVIPTRDMFEDLRLLLQSLVAAGLPALAKEVIVVDDGSVDSTSTAVAELESSPAWRGILKTLRLNPAQGRFEARRSGAKAATSDLVLFIDSRVTLPTNFGRDFSEIILRHRAVMGMTQIDIQKSIYNLYWERTHQTFFRSHYQDVKAGFLLTPQNFDQYGKGTTLLLLDKNRFLQICKRMTPEDAQYSDDTFLLGEYVKEEPVYVTDKCSYTWEPRQTMSSFLLRIYERGENFAYNHWLHERTRFTIPSMVAIGAAIVGVIIIAMILHSIFEALLLAVFGLGLSTALFTRHPIEILKLVVLHVLTLLTFGVGAINAAIKASWERLLGRPLKEGSHK